MKPYGMKRTSPGDTNPPAGRVHEKRRTLAELAAGLAERPCMCRVCLLDAGDP